MKTNQRKKQHSKSVKRLIVHVPYVLSNAVLAAQRLVTDESKIHSSSPSVRHSFGNFLEVNSGAVGV